MRGMYFQWQMAANPNSCLSVSSTTFLSEGVTADGTLLTCEYGAEGKLGHADLEDRLSPGTNWQGAVGRTAGADGRLCDMTHNGADSGRPVDLWQRAKWQTGAR